MLNWSFWVGSSPDLSSPIGRILLGIFAVCVVAGVACRIVAGRRREDRHAAGLLKRVGRLGTAMGVIGLVLIFFTYENVRLFGDRLMYGLWFVITLVWALWIVRHAVKEMPAAREAERVRREKEKYLP